ncbi:MAG: formate dehydrogenase accessory protein FdhE, partial [Desulforhabdus sp.]|nr:formate dehydrogenase accessory protein FdhE [Desulforhabdus sp.]
RGIPLLTMEAIIDGIGDALWVMSAERLMPVMQRSFPKIGEDLEVIEHALRQGRLDPKTPLKASLASEKSLKKALISGIEVSSLTLAFALGQVAKPLIEKISENMRALVEGLSWSKGYCPICGTMPELAFLQGEGGQRWLRCASCSHEWRFTRLVCPFCECNDQQELEVYFVADREYESIDVCHRCGRYVPTVDQRSWSKPIAREVAAMALMHLDVISQEKGFLPAALCAWNIIRSGDIFSTSVRV